MKRKIDRHDMMQCGVTFIEATLIFVSAVLSLPGTVLIKLRDLCDEGVDRIHKSFYGVSVYKEEESD